MEEERRRKRRKRRRRSSAPVIIIMLLFLFTVIGGGAFLYINGNKLMLPGEWSREIDVTEAAVDEAEKYLAGAAFGDEINMEDYISDIRLESLLEVNDDGQLTESLSEESYKQAKEACHAGLEQAVNDLISRRIKENYIDTDMTVDDLIKETFDMSLKEYLDTYGPKLIPDYEELNAEYGIMTTYEAGRDTISIRRADDTISECKYAVSHGMLVIDYSDGAVVYYER